jgi:predicted AlkP superfamily pyrophosphatase or phosphodiesterase
MRRLSLALALVLCTTSLLAQSAPPPPDLVVVISIDQFPYYYIPRFEKWFAADGFNRVLKRGANFTQSRYPYAVTFTGPGHAAIGTGHVPADSGIVANNWYNRTTDKIEYCVDDARTKAAFSPLNLASDSLGDRLQERYDKSKVFGISLKDRAAILMAGRKATAAYWFDPKVGFVSSNYYHFDKPLMDSYNATIPGFVAKHSEWRPSGYIPAADLASVTHDLPKLVKWKSNPKDLGQEFPHTIKTTEQLTYTPFGNELVLQFAERLIDAEGLGTADGNPDLVFVSLSSPDYLGHAYGPDSFEAADTVVVTDRNLQDFFHNLDKKFGNRWTFAITADHGVQSIPEVAKDMGKPWGRVDMRNPDKKSAKTFADLGKQRLALEKAMAKKLGVNVTDATPIDKAFITFFDEPAFYLNWPRVRELKLDGERVKRALRDALMAIDGVSAAFTNSELLMANANPSPLEKAVRLSFRADRSGDVLLTLKAGYIWNYNNPPNGTTHGQPVEADQHVPTMLWGNGIKPGSYDDDVAPTFLAKTLGRLLGVDAGGAETSVLPCVAK